MSDKRHGISIGIERFGDKFHLSFTAKGKLTHQDYQYMVPMIESALAEVQHPEINVVADVTELDGWEVRAAWDDLKLGLAHKREFKKIAVVGSGDFQEWMTKIGSWFMPYDAKFFEDKEQAYKWLKD